MLEYQTPGNVQKSQHKLQPLKNLKPTHKRITIPESACVLKVIEELIQKLEIVDYFEEIVNNEDRLKELIQIDLNNNDPNPDDQHVENIEHVLIFMCQNHRALIERKSNIDQEMKKMLISNSTKDIIRILMKRSKLLASIKDEFKSSKKELPELNEMIGIDLYFRALKIISNTNTDLNSEDLLKELKVFMYERLLLSPMEEEENIKILKQLIINDKFNQEKIEKLKKAKANLLNSLNDKVDRF